MGRRRAQDAAVTLLLTAPSARYQCVSRRFNPTQSRYLSAAPWRQPLARIARPRTIGRRTFASDVKDANIAVLGGGLTGLTTAYYLAKQLPSTAKITLYEGSDRLGGWIRTEKVPVDVGGKKGVVSFERGARSLSSLSGNTWRYDDLVLYDLALDLGLNIESAPNKPRYIYYPDHLVPLPPAINIFEAIREPLFQEAIWGGLGLLFKSLTTKHLEADQSVADWIGSLTMGKTVANNFVSAIVHGIYGGDIDKLSAQSVLDRMYWGWYIPNPGQGLRAVPLQEMALVKTLGQDKQIQKMAQTPKGSLVHFGAAGMESLPLALGQALQEQANVEIKLNSPVKNLAYNKSEGKVTVTGIDAQEAPQTYDKVISTLTSQDLYRITDQKFSSIRESHSVSMMAVNIWYPQEGIKPEGFGYLIPRSVPEENNPEKALGVFFDSDVGVRTSDEPTGTKLFVLLGGHYYDGKPFPTEDEAVQQAKSVLERHLGIPRDTPCHASANLVKECIPQHYVGHNERMVALNQDLYTEFDGRLAVAGGSFTRIGAVAALRAGYDIATQTSKQGISGTGLEALKTVHKFAVVPVSEIPVRWFRGVQQMRK